MTTTKVVEQLLTVKDVADILKIHSRTVWALSRQAEVGLTKFPRPLRLGPKTIRWRMRDLEEYLSGLVTRKNP